MATLNSIRSESKKRCEGKSNQTKVNKQVKAYIKNAIAKATKAAKKAAKASCSTKRKPAKRKAAKRK